MAIRPDDSGDPAERGSYDYQSEDVERPELVADLGERVKGDMRFDSYTRQLYATDASIYEKTPIGVVFPTSTDDVAAVVSYCAEREIPVLPRGGGTSLAGQTVNEAVVLDFTRHMDGLVSYDSEEAVASAQPGITLGELNGELASDGLKFAPDPAWGDKSVLGGAIGNNSTGSHSLKYGKTDAYVESCEVVLADGTVTTFGEVTLDELRERADPDGGEREQSERESRRTKSDGDIEGRIYAEVARIVDEEADEVEERFPDLKRNVSGYNLDMLVKEAREGSVNLAKLLAGSEGTFAVVTEATVSLEPVPETKAVALLTYDDIIDAMEDVAPILEHEPAAVEVMDDVLLDRAAQTDEFREVVGMLPSGTDSVLLVEFYAEDDEHGRQQVADLIADRVPGANSEAVPSDGAAEITAAPRNAVAAMEAHDEDKRARFWKMRKSGLPILLSRTSDEKHFAFLEDTAIPPENLPEFVADFQDILDDHDTFASYYAHAGPGVLHIRPLVNTKTEDGLRTMYDIADEATDLVVKYDGSVSGEHGDGRARTEWNRKLYGDRLWRAFRDLKTAFDPDWLLNPGQVCGYGKSEEVPPRVPERAKAVDMTEDLRFDPEYDFDAGFDPELDWDNDNGLQGMVELCHGCAGCRGDQETTGGVMCPTYRAADEEITSTRGRANMLRQAMSGDLPEDGLFTDEFADEVLDLCIGCKGCKHDCPSGVDMAKLKAEVEHEHHQREGVPLRDRLFGSPETLLAMGSALAPLSNWATKLPGARTAMEKAVGIASERTLPSFERETLRDWYADRGPQVPDDEADRKAMLVADPYTNYSHPEVGKAAVRTLEAAGVHVRIPNDVTDSGRPAFSKSLIDRARATARENVAALAPRIEDGWDVVVAEPSDAVMFQSDYLDLLGDDDRLPREDVEIVAANAYGVLEYLDAFRLDENAAFDAPAETVTYHGHCHQKATKKDHHAVGVLRRAGYRVDPLDSGCCGMAGSFGYEAEHFSMSRAIGDILFDQVDDSDGEVVVAPGASCRTQLGDRDDDAPEPPHPIEKLADAVAD